MIKPHGSSWGLLYVILLSIGLLSGCANPVAPTGGPRDSSPPQLVDGKSSPNKQTEYRPKTIKLYFDEYIEIKNPDRNVIISPPLDPKPSYKAGADFIEVDFSEADSLRAHTTYSLNFDNAISDFNEGNPVENLLFVFSTGEYLDSLSLRVEIENAEKKPAQGITVMLYGETGDDSVVVNSIPTYFSKTNDEGVATLKYLKEGTYKVFALQDDNLTLKYDIPDAPVAFAKEPIYLRADSTPTLKLSLFVPTPIPKITRKPFIKNNAYVGVFNPYDTTVSCRLIPESIELARRWMKDSLYIWLDPSPSRDSIVWVTNNGENLRRDTLAPLQKLDTLPVRSTVKNLDFINREASLSWNQPIAQVSDSAFFVQDSLGRRFFFSILDHTPLKTRIQFQVDSIPISSRELMVLPGSITSVYNYTLSDTLRWRFSVKKPEDLSELILNLKVADSSYHYIGRVQKSNAVIHQKLFTGQNEYLWALPFLEPGAYSLQLFWDQNKNGRLDGGDYWKSRQAEPSQTFSLEPLRANWTIEEEIEWKYETGSKEPN
jgi:uncharacterized protein (DUF2141 family)